MKKLISGVIQSAVSSLLLSVAACAPTIETPESMQQVPKELHGSAVGPSIAKIPWQGYFSEPAARELVQKVLTNNLDLKIALQRIEVARAMEFASVRARFPTVGIFAGTSLRRFGDYTMDGAGNRSTVIYGDEIVPTNLPDYALGAQASWEVDLWGKLKNSAEAAKARVLYSEEGRNALVTELVASAAASYYHLRAITLRVACLEDSAHLQEEALRAVQGQRDVGHVTDLAVKQFQAQLLHIRSLIQEALAERAELEARIHELLGTFPQPLSVSGEPFSKDPPMLSPTAGLPTDLLKKRPDIRQARLAVEATEADLRAAEAAFYPSVSIQGMVGLDAFRTNLVFRPESLAFSALGSLTQPLINRAGIEAEFKIANAQQIEALVTYQKSIVLAFIEVNQAFRKLNAAQELSRLRQEQVAALESASSMAQDLFEIGRSTYLEFLVARQNVLDAQLELIAAQMSERLERISLYRSLGGGWDERVDKKS